MAKNLRCGTTVYQVRGQAILHKGALVSVAYGGVCQVEWLKPDTEWKGSTSREYACDLYRTPRRAILAYVKRVKLNLEIQQDELEA